LTPLFRLFPLPLPQPKDSAARRSASQLSGGAHRDANSCERYQKAVAASWP
jgi:hypothetical protein